MHFTAFDPDGAPRALELPDHPFFIATLFQPERAALHGRTPPLARAFVHAATAAKAHI
jgi:CTP synthase (UTP-ammonia lyase)